MIKPDPQVLLLSLTFAFAIVAVSTFMSIPILLYGLGLGDDGWTWVHVALFSSMVASTDAVAGKCGRCGREVWSRSEAVAAMVKSGRCGSLRVNQQCGGLRRCQEV